MQQLVFTPTTTPHQSPISIGSIPDAPIGNTVSFEQILQGVIEGNRPLVPISSLPFDIPTLQGVIEANRPLAPTSSLPLHIPTDSLSKTAIAVIDITSPSGFPSEIVIPQEGSSEQMRLLAEDSKALQGSAQNMPADYVNAQIIIASLLQTPPLAMPEIQDPIAPEKITLGSAVIAQDSVSRQTVSLDADSNQALPLRTTMASQYGQTDHLQHTPKDPFFSSATLQDFHTARLPQRSTTVISSVDVAPPQFINMAVQTKSELTFSSDSRENVTPHPPTSIMANAVIATEDAKETHQGFSLQTPNTPAAVLKDSLLKMDVPESAFTHHLQQQQSIVLTEISTPRSQELHTQNIQVPLKSPDWGPALHQRVTWMVQEQLHNATITINPPHLGPIEVRIQTDLANQTAIHFMSNSAEVRQVITDNLQALRDAMSHNGLQLGQADVGSRNTSQSSANSYLHHKNDGRNEFLGTETISIETSQKVGLINVFV